MMFDKIKCRIMGHSPDKESFCEVSNQSAKFECSVCKEWFVHNRGMDAILPWTVEMEQFYKETFAEFRK